jgi:predicted TIM-barrel fold metal-dependent hydrolase
VSHLETLLPAARRADFAAARDAAARRHADHGGPGDDLEDFVPCGCLEALLATFAQRSEPWMSQPGAPRPAVGDAEGKRVDAGLPPVTDAHVHVFPDRVFQAIWAWFDRHGYPVRYQLPAPEVARFLLDRGVARVVLLHYSHRPELARSFNAFVAALAAGDPRLVPLGTVLPGEPDAEAIIREAAALGLRGIKLHCHVQGFAPDAPEVSPVWRTCEALGLPVVIHAGREPYSPAYPVDTRAVCGVERMERVLTAHPRLRVCVPHLGADEVGGYVRLLERHDNLWLDTTMMLARFFPVEVPDSVLQARPERILYGSDFPNIPYAWDRELGDLGARRLGDEVRAGILGGNAEAFFAPPAA